jgi:hypothetical protein
MSFYASKHTKYNQQIKKFLQKIYELLMVRFTNLQVKLQ